MTLNPLIKINGTEITEHGRTFSSSPLFVNYDSELASGNTRRYYGPVKTSFNFSWMYLPNASSKTVDGRAARDFLYSLMTAGSLVSLSIQNNEKDEWNVYNCLVSSYNESMLKNVIQSQCRYFDVSMVLEDLG